MKPLAISTLFLCLLGATLACKKNPNNPKPPDEDPDWPADKVRVVLDKNISRPWEILWGPDNHIWMTERGGRISR